MNVLHDHQIFEMQRFGGVSRYFYELWRHAEHAGFSSQIALKYCKSHLLLHDEILRDALAAFDESFAEFLPDKTFPGKGHLFTLKKHFFGKQEKERKRTANRTHTLELLSRNRYDLFHPTYYNPYFLDALKGRPFVLTVFDMIHEIFPEYFKLTERVSRHKQQLCQAASRIIAISEQTKRDLVQIFQIAPEKVDVIYLGNSLHPVAEAQSLDTTSIPEKYLLFTGSRKHYKNFYFFLRAVAEFFHEDSALRLVCAGEPFSQEERAFFTTIDLQEGQICHVKSNDAMLAHLYRHALAFVFPSIYEGFGIPILEAFACGCPAILSNTSSLPEVGGDAAIYFAPKDWRSIQEAVDKVISHAEIRNDLIIKGYERLKLFSWETTARKTCDVYKKAINQG